MKLPLFTTIIAIPAFVAGCAADQKQPKPNVIIVLTDDQGIGGVGCHDNPYLKTPNIDSFYEQCVRMTDFHVSPLSTPTRGAIMTGRYPIRNGAWATYKGRDIISRTSPTIAEVFRAGGYSTALFGKWHLGDNYPCRPIDCGFDYSVNHRAGGVGELSDYWGNNYFDDTYLVNEEPVKFDGYCTDVWFSEAQRYIESCKDSDKPFFVYLATNAPHEPHYVDKSYSEPYQQLEDDGVLDDAGFYGTIANIDENFGKLDSYLKSNGLDKNTILIFMTDNGAWHKDNTWIYGFSGAKGSILEGGHRVPFFMRWADGGIVGGRDIGELTAHVDLLPTLAALCGVDVPSESKIDGVDFSPLLTDGEAYEHSDRTLFIHNRQDSKPPMDVKGSLVARGDWRLLDGMRLYNVSTDRAQKRDVASDHPEVVRDLLSANETFIAETKQMEEYKDFIPVYVGSPQQRVAVLSIQHAIGESNGIWKSEQVCAGAKVNNDTFALEFVEQGRYRISLSRWPRECQGLIWGVPDENPKNWYSYSAIRPEMAEIKVFGETYTALVDGEMKEVDFEIYADQGRTLLSANFIEHGRLFGAYYIYVEKI